MRSWRRIDAKRLFGCPVFDLDRVRFQPPAGGAPRPYYVIDSPNWINVIPLTDDDRVLLIKQYRFGIEGFTLEIPGGMCDAGESPLESAGRELVEETGYRSDDLVEIGWVHPNPAIQSNRCYTFVARKLTRAGEPSPDPDEEFELVTEPLERIPELIAGRKITHALVLAAFELFSTRQR